MAQGTALKPAVKAHVMAALLQGQGVNEIARAYKLSSATVSGIKNSLLPEHVEQLQTQKRETLDVLLLEAVSANVRTLTKIAEAVSDPKYITSQPAESIGMLYGILADKAVRFLEAASAANISDPKLALEGMA